MATKQRSTIKKDGEKVRLIEKKSDQEHILQANISFRNKVVLLWLGSNLSLVFSIYVLYFLNPTGWGEGRLTWYIQTTFYGMVALNTFRFVFSVIYRISHCFPSSRKNIGGNQV